MSSLGEQLRLGSNRDNREELIRQVRELPYPEGQFACRTTFCYVRHQLVRGIKACSDGIGIHLTTYSYEEHRNVCQWLYQLGFRSEDIVCMPGVGAETENLMIQLFCEWMDILIQITLCKYTHSWSSVSSILILFFFWRSIIKVDFGDP